MKPVDRALQFVAVGLGQAGGNIAAEFSRLGYRAMALNTAHTDLSALAPGSQGDDGMLSPEQRVYIGLDGYDGAGADLNYGRECIRENAERIRQAVGAHAEGADVVILAAGLGGGTGSALSELLDVLNDLHLPVVTLATLPGEHESGIAKVNAARGVSELVKRRPFGWVFADNQRLAQSHGTLGLDRYFETINQVIVAPLDALNRLNNRKGVHPLRTLDGEDLRRLLLSSGVLNYAETVLPDLSIEAVTEGIREALLSNGVMPAGFSLEEVAYMGVVLEAPESTLSGTPFSFFEQLSEQLKNDTGGGAIYVGMYRTPAIEGGAARLRLLGSSQSLPSGIQGVVNDAKREGGTLRDKLNRAVDSLDLGEIEEFDLFKTHTRTNNGRKRAIQASELRIDTRSNDFLHTNHPTPAPEPASQSLQTQAAFDASTATELPREGTSNIPPSGPIQRPSNDSDTYTKLADAFLNAGTTSIRRRIARRLDVAQNSESSLIREHAEHAVGRIQQAEPGAFEAALSMEAEQQAAKG